MTTFEKCKSIRDSILTRAGEMLTYGWSDDFKLSNMNDIHKSISKWEEKYGSFRIDPNDLTEIEMEELGFSSWSEDSKLKLIPIWIFPFLSECLDVESISGEKYTKKSDIDNDHRYGLLAYGVNPTNRLARDRKIKEIES
jgi:hypothetical protein